jgi:ECF sigma factor
MAIATRSLRSLDFFSHSQKRQVEVKPAEPVEKNMETSSQQVSNLLRRWSEGDSEALDQLMPLVYAELRRMARRYMGQQPAGHTLQTTALIHEAYLRLVGQEEKRGSTKLL